MKSENPNNPLGWNFDNTYAKLPSDLYSTQLPAQVSSPHLLLFNTKLALQLGFYGSMEDYRDFLCGNKLTMGANPLSQAYAGHQFGHFTVLGDGRAVLLGEQITPQGKRFDIQLKGAGRTPYARGGDGKATLGAMLREYIMSEALHGLGIPTSRSLAVVASGEPVFRESPLPGAILTRVATSHIRVGTFEYVSRYYPHHLQAFADYTILRHFPDLHSDENPYKAFLISVMEKQTDLICDWMRVGFIHGVMNTDNMAISGETIDYGPCAFMNAYNPHAVFSSIDTHGRYAFANQPKIAQWNLACLAGALLPLFSEDKQKAIAWAKKEIESFQELYEKKWLKMMRKKLGLISEQKEDVKMILSLLKIMEDEGADYTLVFRHLAYNHNINETLFVRPEFESWKKEWMLRLKLEDVLESQLLMQSTNPIYIPRNHWVEEAIADASSLGEFNKINELLEVLQTPYDLLPDKEKYENPPKGGDMGYKTFCGT